MSSWHCSFGIVPLGYLVSKAAPLIIILECVIFSWNTMQKVPDLHQPPYPPFLFLGERLTMLVAAIALAWEIIKFAMLVIIVIMNINPKKISMMITVPISLIEIGMIGCMAGVLQLQSTYAPLSCKNVVTWEYDNVGKPSLFVALSQHWTITKNNSPQQICTLFKYKRTVGIIYTVIHSLFTLPFVLILLLVLLFISAFIYHKCLLTIRLISSFLVKVFRSCQNPGKAQASSKDIELQCYSPAQIHGAISTVDPFNTLEQLNQTPHFAAVMGEIKSSGGHSLSDKILTFAEIRRNTCKPGAKSECWGCGGQICTDCKVTQAMDDPPTTVHIENCESVCTYCQLRRSFRPHLYPDFLVRDRECSHRPAKDGKVMATKAEKDLCSTCVTESTSKVLESRARTEEAEMANLESDMVICALCRKQVRFGPRWWICSICGVSCNSKLHAAWVTWRDK